MGVDEQHIVVVHDHAGVRSDDEIARPLRVVDAGHDLGELEVDGLNRRRTARSGAAPLAAAPWIRRSAPGTEPRHREDAGL